MKYTVRLWQREPTIALFHLTQTETWSLRRDDAWELPIHGRAQELARQHGGFVVPVDPTASSHTDAVENLQVIKHHPHGRNWLLEWQEETGQ